MKVRQFVSISTLSTTDLILLVAFVVVVVGGIAAFLLLRKRRTTKLRAQFGDAEYTRAVEKSGNRRNAEAGLEGRAQRVESCLLYTSDAADE